MADKKSKEPEVKPLTNKDILRSQGLVEVYDSAVGAYRQVKIEDAKKMVENLEQVKKDLEEADK